MSTSKMTEEMRNYLREIGRIGGKNSVARLSERQLRAKARKAAAARWKKAKESAA